MPTYHVNTTYYGNGGGREQISARPWYTEGGIWVIIVLSLMVAAGLIYRALRLYG